MSKEKRSRRHQPLEQQYLSTVTTRKNPRIKSSSKQEEAAEYVEGGLSQKILSQARQQQAELEDHFAMGGSLEGERQLKRKRTKPTPTSAALGGKSLLDSQQLAVDSDEEDSSEDEFIADDESAVRDYDPIIDEEDEKAMQVFMNPEEQPRRTLADIIQEKIRDKETEIASRMTESVSLKPQMDERVESLFKGVAKILSKYRSGKLPKAFKVIPSLSNWEDVLYLTDPDQWTAAAMFQATRIFASNLNTVKAQRFYNLVLLPRIRDDISEYKRLNFHLYMALKKSLFKPAGFFKGILLPLCESGTCTLREALIVSSVLAKTSIPMLHSSAAILKIAEMDYTGANSIFIRTLLDKKYALPYKVVDAVVFHFVRFTSDQRDLPVLWHQSLLTFVQRYKEDMSVEQKGALMELIRKHTHHDITHEIRREILNSKCRDVGETFVNRTQGSMDTK